MYINTVSEHIGRLQLVDHMKNNVSLFAHEKINSAQLPGPFQLFKKKPAHF